MRVVQLFLRIKLLKRSRLEPIYGSHIPERFGSYSHEPEKNNLTKSLIWIHAVSLGESRAAGLLIDQLRRNKPGLRFLLTHGTATGRQEGARWMSEKDIQVWQPWDTPIIADKFLCHFKPHIGLLMETEVWPNMVRLCKSKGIPLLLINARMSDKSYKKARKLSWLSKDAFSNLYQVLPQSELDAIRLRDLGAKVSEPLGNMKFDAGPVVNQLEQSQVWRVNLPNPVVVLASSREGEELALLQALTIRNENKLNPSTIQWMIVPRHPQRFDDVAQLVVDRGFRLERRTDWENSGPSQISEFLNKTIWLGDSMGEMSLYFGMSQLAFLGGSFEPLGGQNLIEATACGCPILMGPHTFNFSQVAEQATTTGCAVTLESMQSAVDLAYNLVQDPTALNAMSIAAKKFSKAHQGTVEKISNRVMNLLD